MAENLINLYSDTQTRPTPAMRQVMAEAPVGDEQKGEDPSVNRLCAMTAELVGKEDAVFLPSGTMCNEIAILVHCRKGDEIIADKTAHIINSEAGGPAALAGALIRPLDGMRGVYTADQAETAVRVNSRYTPTTSMIVVEQTSNFGGGTVWPLETIRAIAEVARRHELALHMDGARLMNACVASGVAAADYAAPFDSLWIDLSKGLGCPIGGVLAGSGDFIARAWRWKQRLGGAMRQAGIIAAAGVYALENNVERLAEDHANARLFADRLADVPGIAVKPEAVETNIVFFGVGGIGLTADQVADRLADHGVRIGPMGEDLMRAVTHLDVTTEQVAKAAAAVRAVVEAA
ncbi:MAG: threonine aldolase family protein [Limibaculum sp.]